MQKVVISFTTSPKRINECDKMLHSILNQSKKADLILLNIPDKFSRTQETYVVPEKIKNLVTINYCGDDYGPCTKLIPTIKYLNDHNYDPDTKIIYCDDDIYYLPTMIQSYYVYNDDHIHCICGFNFIDYNIHGERGNLKNAMIAEGYGAVCVKLKVFKDDFIPYIKKVIENKETRLSDDVFISNYYHKNKYQIKIHCIPNVYSIFDLWEKKCILDYGNQYDALHLGANNTSTNNENRYRVVIKQLQDMNELYIIPYFSLGKQIYQMSLTDKYNFQNRVNYYLNKTEKQDISKINKFNHLLIIPHNKSKFNIECNVIYKLDGETIMKELKNKRSHQNFHLYAKPLLWHLINLKTVKDNDFLKKDFLFRWGDWTEITNQKFITKARNVNDKYATILNLNKERHWELVKYVPSFDIDFNEKKALAVWRGDSTGYLKSEKNDRLKFVELYYDVSYADVGFSSLNQTKHFDKKFLKGKIELKEQLKYKYIVSIEGNDVASGLKWQLYSNSVVLMKKPTKVSWLMEDCLVPYEHYVPLKDDFSNLQEQINWCNDNTDKCKYISKNATQYVLQFMNDKNENLISSQILLKYFDCFSNE